MLKIRKYHSSDWNSICELHDLARPAELEGTVSLDAFIPLKDAAKNEGLFDGDLFVGELECTIIGFIAWEPNEITWLYVHPKFQRRGYGRKLLHFAVSKLTKPSEGFKIIEKVKGKLAGNEKLSAEGYKLNWGLETCIVFNQVSNFIFHLPWRPAKCPSTQQM